MKIFTTRLLITFFSIFFLSMSFQVVAQNNEFLYCGTVTTPESIEYFNAIKPQLQKYEQDFLLKKTAKINSSLTKNSIPIKVNIIRSSNGFGGLDISHLNVALEIVNRIYGSALLEFFLCDGINYIDADEFNTINKGEEHILSELYNTNGLLNIYITDKVENESGESICGYADNSGRNDIIVIKTDCIDSSLAHEIGHYFGLMHTHGLDDTKTTELVNGSNCDTTGDGICDTPADPVLSYSNVNNSCEYIGTETDANGERYKPDTSNFMSYSRKECRNNFTSQQLARMYAFYQTAKSYLSCQSFNANFTADTSQTCEDILTVNFESSSENISKWEWDINNDGITDYTTQNPSHTFNNGVYDITLIVSNKSKTIKKTLTNFIKVGTQTPLLNEDFENIVTVGDHGWTAKDNSGHGYNWLLNKGETISKKTGPTLTNSGNNFSNTYIYAEASGAKLGDIAEIISPCINIDYENSEIEFSYHMFGEHMGELHVDIKTENGYINDVIEPLKGNQQQNQEDDFLIHDIDLSDYINQTINIRFRAIRGSSWDGDIAIDNIAFKTITTSITDIPVKVYPNPINGNLLFVKTNNPNVSSTFYISNIEGQIFKSGTLTNQPINVENLSSGMYLITVQNKDSRITKKVIK